MTLGTDILQAVKCGGSENWIPQCQKIEKSRKPAKLLWLDVEITKLYESIGNDKLTCQQWALRMGWKVDLIRCRAQILIRQGKIKRTTGKQPYLFFKV